MKESEDVDRAQDTVAAITQQLADLEAQFKEDTAALEQSFDAQTESLETVAIKPKKADIAVKHLSLAWAPYWHDGQGQITPGWE